MDGKRWCAGCRRRREQRRVEERACERGGAARRTSLVSLVGCRPAVLSGSPEASRASSALGGQECGRVVLSSGRLGRRVVRSGSR